MTEPLVQLSLFSTGDPWIWRQAVASETLPSVTYTVAYSRGGTWGCSCPAWIYDPTRRPCKHIRAVLSSLEVPGE